jgi:hypothetical protein
VLNFGEKGEVVRLEALIEELAAKVENCRKFILASRIATWGGGIVRGGSSIKSSGWDYGRPLLNPGR